MIWKYRERESRDSNIIRYERNLKLPDDDVPEIIFFSELACTAGNVSEDRSQLYFTVACRACISWHQSIQPPTLHRQLERRANTQKNVAINDPPFLSIPLRLEFPLPGVDAYAETPFEPSELIYVRTNGQNRIHYCLSGTTTKCLRPSACEASQKSVYKLTRIISLDRKHVKSNAFFF